MLLNANARKPYLVVVGVGPSVETGVTRFGRGPLGATQLLAEYFVF
jgi:hypothetical protein